MFTLEQTKEAHSKVRSGADFPAYIRELKALGVLHYDTYVADGHTVFCGAGGYKIATPDRYADQVVSENCNPSAFAADLKAHQQGKTDYAAFCNSCATYGVDRWTVDTTAMTCTYYDKDGNEVLVEVIPG